MPLFISEKHISIEGGESDFYDTAIHFLATHKATSINFVYFLLSPVGLQCSPVDKVPDQAEHSISESWLR